jgi:hypothetical protein
MNDQESTCCYSPEWQETFLLTSWRGDESFEDPSGRIELFKPISNYGLCREQDDR